MLEQAGEEGREEKKPRWLQSHAMKTLFHFFSFFSFFLSFLSPSASIFYPPILPNFSLSLTEMK